MTSRKSFFFTVLLLSVCFVALNVAVRLTAGNITLDLTEGKIFTLSEEAQELAADTDEKITLRFFYSNSLTNGYPALKAFADRIIATLNAYAGASNGNITVQIIDPKPFTEDEDLAVSYGLKPAPIDNKGTEVYFGLVAANEVDETRKIPVFHFQRERFIEYDIGRMIVDLSQEEKPVIGVLTTLPMDAPGLMGIPGLGGGKAWIFLDQLRENFEVKRVEEDAEEISTEEFAAILIAQPKEMPETMLYAIEQYALKGGRIAMFLDPNAEGKGGNSGSDASFNDDINKLLRHWGVYIPATEIAVDRYAARKVHNKDLPGTHIDYLGWLELRGDRIVRSDPVTAMLDTINVATPGAIMTEEGAENPLTVQPLLKTEATADTMSIGLVRGNPNPKRLLENFNSQNTEYTLAARLTGDANSMFAKFADKEGHAAASSRPLNIVLVADTDLLKDESWARSQEFEGNRIVMPMADNGDFAVNILDHLAGSELLVQLRGKGANNRPFDVVQKLKKDAETRYLKDEQELKDRLAQTENRLAELKKQAEQPGGEIYRAEQQSEIQRFVHEMQNIKRNLRKVSHKLREEINALGGKLKIINIWGVALIAAALALFAAHRRSARAKQSRPVPQGFTV